MRGMQEPDAEWLDRIEGVWAADDTLDADELVARIDALAAELPADHPRGLFERGGARDSTGDEEGAAEFYARAARGPLEPEIAAQLAVQYGSTLRNLGRLDESLAVLDAALAAVRTEGDPHHYADALAAFRALTLHDLGRPAEALAVALRALTPHLPRYHRSLSAYADALTSSSAGDVSAAASRAC